MDKGIYRIYKYEFFTIYIVGFNGGGVELSPGNWRIAFMAGQMKKAIDYDVLNSSSVIPSYKRMGYGLKVGYEEGSGSISVNIFTASDVENSVHQLPPDGSLHPMQNMALGISGRTSLFKQITLQGEYSFSILNGDTRMLNQQSDSITTDTDNDPLSTLAPGTRTFDAYSLGIGYQTSPFGIMLQYERVAPDYQTLGAYYFNNDMENFTIAPGFRLFEGRLSVTGNAGIQKNNLDKSRESTTKRWVGAGNITFNPSDKWNLGMNFSNFSTYTRMRPLADPFFQNELDSLNFYQITNQIGGLVNYTFGTKESPHSVMLNLSNQKVAETSPDAENNSKSGFISANASYSHIFPKPALSVSFSYNMNASRAPAMKSFYKGPALNVSKTFLDKTLRTGLVLAWNQNTMNGQKGSPVMSNGLNLVYSPEKSAGGKHTLTFNLNLLQRFPSETQEKRSEITGNLNYSFTF